MITLTKTFSGLDFTLTNAIKEYECFIKENKYIKVISVNIIEKLGIVLLTYEK